PVSQSWTRATLTGEWPRGGSARRGGDPLPPVVEELGERALEGDLDLPAGGPLDLARIPLQLHHVGGREPRRIGAHRDALHAGTLEEEVQHLLDGPGAARAEAVELAGLAALQQRPVAAHDVADIRVVALGLEVAHEHHRLAHARLDL